MQNANGQVIDCSTQGMGIIGTAAALSMHSDCVKKAQASGFHEVNASSVAPKPSEDAAKVTIALPIGWEKKDLTENMAKGGGSVFATNKALDTGLLLSVASKQGVSDLMAYAFSKRSKAEDAVLNGQSSDIKIIEVNGRQAFQFEVAGFVKGGVKITYLYTLIVGTEQIAVVNVWAKSTDYAANKGLLESMASKIAGLA
jgi:hypothetical protein